MSWTAPSGHVFTVGEIVTAATMNTYIKDNLIDLDRRTTITGATVATSQTTASVSYVDLTTAGPAVTVTIGATGQALIAMYGALSNNTVGGGAAMSYAISGATTQGASDGNALIFTSAIAGVGASFGFTYLVSGLAAGSTTFTAKYRAGSNTATFAFRNILVTPLGS